MSIRKPEAMTTSIAPADSALLQKPPMSSPAGSGRASVSSKGRMAKPGWMEGQQAGLAASGATPMPKNPVVMQEQAQAASGVQEKSGEVTAQGAEQNGHSEVGGSQPSLITLSPDDSIESILQRMLDSDSPLMQQARQRGLRHANSRGLLNSNVAAQSAEEAMIKEATPFALQEAQQALQVMMANQEAQNKFGLQRDQQDWQSGESEIGRSHDLTLQDNQFEHDVTMQDDQQGWLSGENAKDRSARLAAAGITAGATVAAAQIRAASAEKLAEADREFAVEDRDARFEFDRTMESTRNERADSIREQDRGWAVEDRGALDARQDSLLYSQEVINANSDFSRELSIINSNPDTSPTTKANMRRDAQQRRDDLVRSINTRYGRDDDDS